MDLLDSERNKLFTTGSTFLPASASDIVGIDVILKKVNDLIEWLRNIDHFSHYNARWDSGVLLEGLPGTGKTMCSRYIATQSKALFINVRDFPIMDNEPNPRDVSDLFKRARAYYKSSKRPVILFWDEFETFARDRMQKGLRDSGAVAQLAAELDGVSGKCDGVLLIACTNYKDMIDSALLRAGRMGLHISFTAPDRIGKAHLLEHYLRDKNLEGSIDFESAAFFFDENDTAATVEEGASKVWSRAVGESLRANREPVITEAMIHDVLLDNLLGPPPPFMEMTKDTERHVAIHELGHAITAHDLGIPVKIITIRPGRDSWGRTFVRSVNPQIDTVEDQLNMISSILGSVACEKVIGYSINMGAKSDLQKATEMAIELVDGMGYGGTPLHVPGYSRRTSSNPGTMSDMLKSDLDARIVRLLDDCFRIAEDCITSIPPQDIEKLADSLISYKTWTGKQFEEMTSALL